MIGLWNDVAAISAGSKHTCALTTAGAVKCWGDNRQGQLGDGTTQERLSPVDVEGLDSGVVSISAGGSRSCALTTAGGVKCWGGGISGDGTLHRQLSPVDVVEYPGGPALTGVAAIGAVITHTCVVMTTGGMKCWGNNSSGQLGDGTTMEIRTTPVDVVDLGGDVVGMVGGRGWT